MNSSTILFIILFIPSIFGTGTPPRRKHPRENILDNPPPKRTSRESETGIEPNPIIPISHGETTGFNTEFQGQGLEEIFNQGPTQQSSEQLYSIENTQNINSTVEATESHSGNVFGTIQEATFPNNPGLYPQHQPQQPYGHIHYYQPPFASFPHQILSLNYPLQQGIFGNKQWPSQQSFQSMYPPARTEATTGSNPENTFGNIQGNLAFVNNPVSSPYPPEQFYGQNVHYAHPFLRFSQQENNQQPASSAHVGQGNEATDEIPLHPKYKWHYDLLDKWKVGNQDFDGIIVKKETAEYICEICGEILNSKKKSHVLKHCKGDTHKLKKEIQKKNKLLKEWKKENHDFDDIIVDKEANYYCNICNRTLNEEKDFVLQHCEMHKHKKQLTAKQTRVTRKHKTKKEQYEEMLKNMGFTKNQLTIQQSHHVVGCICNLCGAFFYVKNENTIIEHLNSQDHKNGKNAPRNLENNRQSQPNLSTHFGQVIESTVETPLQKKIQKRINNLNTWIKENENINGVIVKEDTADYFCTLCKTTFKKKYHLVNHCNGVNHIKMKNKQSGNQESRLSSLLQAMPYAQAFWTGTQEYGGHSQFLYPQTTQQYQHVSTDQQADVPLDDEMQRALQMIAKEVEGAPDVNDAIQGYQQGSTHLQPPELSYGDHGACTQEQSGYLEYTATPEELQELYQKARQESINSVIQRQEHLEQQGTDRPSGDQGSSLRSRGLGSHRGRYGNVSYDPNDAKGKKPAE